MKPSLQQSEEGAHDKIVSLSPQPQLVAKPKPKERAFRFRIVPFLNRGGSKAWRVSGIKRDGARVRENFDNILEAQNRQSALEIEWLSRESLPAIRSTRLTEAQVDLAETCFKLVEDDSHVLTAVKCWIANGRQQARPNSPRLDDAFAQFEAWVDGSDTMRHLTKIAAKWRVKPFVNSTPNLRVSEVTPETVEKFLDTIKGTRSRINYKFGVSKFFAFCMDRPRRWVVSNPCAAIRIRSGDFHAPEILSVEACEKLMREAATLLGGRLVPYVALALFEGLRPFEARRLAWEQINFEDGEIRIEGKQTKTKRPRSFALHPTTLAWLRQYRQLPLPPANLNKALADLIERCGFGKKTLEHPERKPWTKDVMRHTAISHYFRLTGSYGKAAERFGNSEGIIRRHYQGRVTSEETKRFFAILPTK